MTKRCCHETSTVGHDYRTILNDPIPLTCGTARIRVILVRAREGKKR